MAARRKTSPGGDRFYVWGRDSDRYWSVTTIIKNGTPKRFLQDWAARTVAEAAFDFRASWIGLDRARAVDFLKREPYRYTGSRGDVGSAVHQYAEAVALGKPHPPLEDPEERLYGAVFLDFVARARPAYVLTEEAVYSRAQRYAGTLDAIVDIPVAALDELKADLGIDYPWSPAVGATVDGAPAVRLLIDYKTGRAVYPEVGLQLNAYGRADFVGLPNGEEAPLPAVDGAAVLHLTGSGWSLIPVRLGDDIYKAFLYCREIFRFQDTIEPTILGTPLHRETPQEVVMPQIKAKLPAPAGGRWSPDALVVNIGKTLPMTSPGGESMGGATIVSVETIEDGAFVELTLDIPGGILPPGVAIGSAPLTEGLHAPR